MNRFFILSAALLLTGMVCRAGAPEGFRSESVGRTVGELGAADSIDLSSPLSYYLSRAWVRTSGKARMWKDISTSKFNFPADAPDEEVDSATRGYVLNETVDGIVTYRDSVAALITHTPGEDLYLLNYCWIEDGRWVNGGQGMADTFGQAEEQLLRDLPRHFEALPRIALVAKTPESPAPFADFLRGVESSPEDFLLDMLGERRLVVNGELHRRKVSWDMLCRLIARPEFPERAGCVFLELPSWCQELMDRFMDSDSGNEELVYRIFREEQPNGWWDRGEFDFILDLRRLNRSLPAEKRVRVVLADYQVPYSRITSADEREAEDRNTHMADVIERTLRTSGDSRGSLFLVGCAHAYKSDQAGFASSAAGAAPEKTAGAQLADRLGAENVFTVFQHCLSGDNSGRYRQPLRGGVFDRAFELNGNRPVGFLLAGSPFGAEPFDGIHEIKYGPRTGSYADNYDGYLFLHPLAEEPTAAPLTEIFTDEFVAEMKRRAKAMGLENYRWMWFGVTAPELTRRHVIEALGGE